MEGQENYDLPALKAKLTKLLGNDARAYPVGIEAKFPRILARLVDLWGKPECDAYLEALMVSDRPGRQGFPPDVAMEVFRLSTLHGSLGLSPQPVVGTGWAGVTDAELYRREFIKKQK